MIKRYSVVSFILFVPGVVLQLLGLMLEYKEPPSAPSGLGIVFLIIGTVMAIAGLGYYAKAKGHSIFWGVAGCFGVLGLAILAVMTDRRADAWESD